MVAITSNFSNKVWEVNVNFGTWIALEKIMVGNEEIEVKNLSTKQVSNL